MNTHANKQHYLATAQPAPAALEAGQKVLRDTYRLLSATLLFSAVVAGLSAALRLPAPGLLLTLGGYFALLFLTFRLRNSAWGLLSVFALTGFMGYTLGPVIGHYLALANGPQLVATTMGITGLAFLGLSAYARSAGAVNTASWGSFLMIGILTAFGLGLAALLFQMPALSLAVSGVFVLLMCGLIMFETQNIVRGGETNYIIATVSLFVSIYNLFMSLLHITGFLGGEEA
ncbi:MAG: Bax inhibitor-1/YccA family protein [Halioglobus sp.]